MRLRKIIKSLAVSAMLTLASSSAFADYCLDGNSNFVFGVYAGLQGTWSSDDFEYLLAPVDTATTVTGGNLVRTDMDPDGATFIFGFDAAWRVADVGFVGVEGAMGFIEMEGENDTLHTFESKNIMGLLNFAYHGVASDGYDGGCTLTAAIGAGFYYMYDIEAHFLFAGINDVGTPENYTATAAINDYDAWGFALKGRAGCEALTSDNVAIAVEAFATVLFGDDDADAGTTLITATGETSGVIPGIFSNTVKVSVPTMWNLGIAFRASVFV